MKKKYKTKEEAIVNKKKEDRLFHDPYLDEYFVISPRKYIWKEGEFEENFVIMPETLEECINLRSGNCQDCEYLTRKMGSHQYCKRKVYLSNIENMELL